MFFWNNRRIRLAFRSPWPNYFWMPYDDTGKHPICIRAEKFPRPEAGESQRDETSCSPHQNPRARWGECVRRRCMRSGRPLRPPLQTRLRFSRRGGLYGRPNRVPIPAGDRWFHRRRGAFGEGACGPGGHKARPYRPAFGSLVGAALMAARTGFRFPPGIDGSTAVGAHCICALAAPPGSLSLRRKSRAC